MRWRRALRWAEAGRLPTPPVELFAALIAADSGTMARAKEAPLGTPNCQVENWWGSLPIGTGKIVSLNKAQQDADPQGKALTGFLDLRCRLTACFARDACKGQQPRTAGRQRERTFPAGLRSAARGSHGSQLTITAEPQ
jgi:hypothetical protein